MVGIDPDTTTDEELREMHDLGARGVRVNLKSWGQRWEYEAYASTLARYVDRLKKFGWVIQLYVGLDQFTILAPIIRDLGIDVVFDHVGSPSREEDSREQTGYPEFMELLKLDHVYVKLSGTYRFDGLPNLDGYVRDILTVAPDRVVYASDWPHTQGKDCNPGGDRTRVQKYREVDDEAFTRQCLDWCAGDQNLIRKIFVDNPRRLWRYDKKD